ncbi:glycosyltransferase family 4 protein [Oryzicola mucosus]|uniref:Glycosyltransferase family 1 protein n=1 Tax=Oryzicola mucosus TaxID=2767425 RepID=A0A8J6PF97_9HYPH|nr:glycosyltransferase family 1 protein [Oryzicola mucosus]MBD0414049.1 glycosyltransferase family 1 protein [Oryzicola mucosus]
MRVLIVTDAWYPQINGVVRTLVTLAETLAVQGVEVAFLTPEGYPTLPLPSYPEIRLSLATPRRIGERIAALAPDAVHIATEGPLGCLARHTCLSRGMPFTTSYHTKFPEFLSARLPFPEDWAYGWLRRFHNAGEAMLVATPSLAAQLSRRGFSNIVQWGRGVDAEHFHPRHRRDIGLPGPVFLSVGRVAVEKNLPAFLDLDLPGSKVVVGDGPERERLKAAYPDAHFLGLRQGRELAEIYASADVFVFPSRTDTFGNVLLEALASGCPVAAYPVTGPLDVFADGRGGVLDDDLGQAALAALQLPRSVAREKALDFTWAECARQFLRNIEIAPRSRSHPGAERLRKGMNICQP